MFKFTKMRILYVFCSIFFILIQIFISQYKIKTEINENIMIEQHQAENKFNQNEAESVVESKDTKEHIEKNVLW